MSSSVLLLPGWQNSGPDHWQSLWESEYGYLRVQEHDWERPLRGDWIIQLEEAVLAASTPVSLVAHSLGCIQVAAWAAHSRNVNKVHSAFLVAPPDVEREEFQPLLSSWSPIERSALPFTALVVASSNDPFCAYERAQALACNWVAEFKNIGPAGHINADSGLGHWAQAHEWLRQLQQTTHTV
jgi:predicted alpha/beta hydrolase family esterase